ncbi:MAG: NAD(+) synthase [Clostridia bacterium]|nr:NAD(+) synthase [Clostridia bacterium]
MSCVSGMIRTMAASPRVYLANPKKNAEEIASVLRIADENGVQLCVFPELCLTGATCGDLFLQPSLLSGALESLRFLAELPVETTFIVGLPLDIDGRLYNCAAVVSGGDVRIVPKEHLAQDARWFSPGHTAPDWIQILSVGLITPVCHTPVIDCGEFLLGVEIGTDITVPEPPSGKLCMNGALIIAHPDASSEIVTAHAARTQLLKAQSRRCICGYVHANAGYGESTTDTVFSGYAGIYENGKLLAENERFARQSTYAIADIDADRLLFRRRKNHNFYDDQGSRRQDRRENEFSCSALDGTPYPENPGRVMRPLSATPFIPDGTELQNRATDALLIQTQGLLARMEHIRTRRIVVGVSGGLDSTLALLICAYAYERAGWDKKDIIGITMPGFGTGKRTKGNAEMLMERIGCTALEIPIGPAVTQHFADIGQSADVHDICYENSQARERTQIVMDYANKTGALALGTGDLSELALGWCTYNGDHMSMYNPNGSVPKTLMRYLVRFAGEKLGGDVLPVVEDILDTPISPELIPSKEGELGQRTEDTLGAYALHDFFLYHMMDSGAEPSKLYALALQAFDGQYGKEAILNALRTFVRRFFTQQFKRSALPDGAAIGSVSLSPRGAWLMPSDAQMALWMDEVDALS